MFAQPGPAGKMLRGIESICNGCRSRELICSFSLTGGFRPGVALTTVEKDERNGIDRPVTQCLAVRCASGGELALCVDYCPTGALIFGDEVEYQMRLDDLWEARQRNPEHRFHLLRQHWWPLRAGAEICGLRRHRSHGAASQAGLSLHR